MVLSDPPTDHQQLPWESDFHLPQLPYNWTLQADAKPRKQTTLLELRHFISCRSSITVTTEFSALFHLNFTSDN